MSQKIIIFILVMVSIISCGKEISASNGLFFTQETLNYNFTRYENDEAVCYVREEVHSCLKK